MMLSLKTSSITRPTARQAGYALILMLVALMGIGGVAITGFTRDAKQETEHQRYLHNQRVLKEAKQALLQYAYNYPEIALAFNGSVRGPGRLPCPDNDIFGEAGFGKPDPHVTNYCVFPDNRPGRFPWDTDGMQFYEARDASGEHLWYAVSDNFNNFASSYEINSSTPGTITLRGQGGQLLYDGATAGIAAVIIAPGPPIDRDGTLQVRGTDAEKKNATNYLDLFGLLDNAEFIDGDSSNGFVPGPIVDRDMADLIVNDQLIIVTAAEVIAMAEKATLQAYRTAINDYLANTDGVYPWLYNYDGIEYDPGAAPPEDIYDAIDRLSNHFPGDALFATEKATYLGIDNLDDANNDGIFGRIPSIFASFFTEVDSQPIETFVGGSMTLIDPGVPDTFTLTENCVSSCPRGTAGNRTFARDPDPDVEGPKLDIGSGQLLTDVGFVDGPDVVGKDGQITATFPTPALIPFDLYFWGAHDSPGTNWTACPGGANELSDCTGLSSDRSILHLSGTIDFSGDAVFDFDYNFPPTIEQFKATGTSHAWTTGTYPANAIISFPGVLSAIVNYEYEGHWHSGDTSIEIGNSTYVEGYVDMTGYSLDSLTLGMRYFPELPGWAIQNGWHNSIRMAYALEYEPPGTGPCIVDTTCLKLDDAAGTPQDKISLLVIAGQHDWTDTDLDGKLTDEMEDDRGSVFDNDNLNDDETFYSHRGNDKILVIQ